MKPTQTKEWNIKLRVSLEEEIRIKKEAIENRMRISEYIKVKVLGNSSTPKASIEGKLS